jgi:hypothetical protein
VTRVVQYCGLGFCSSAILWVVGFAMESHYCGVSSPIFDRQKAFSQSMLAIGSSGKFLCAFS